MRALSSSNYLIFKFSNYLVPSLQSPNTINMLSQDLFIHHVYFWLATPESKDDHAALLAGLEALSKVPSIQQFHIGVPASTNRDVIETTYQFSWLAVFPSREAQDAYQEDPVHLHFVATCKHLWKKVTVYDSIAAY
jgi:hypothetical protein